VKGQAAKDIRKVEDRAKPRVFSRKATASKVVFPVSRLPQKLSSPSPRAGFVVDSGLSVKSKMGWDMWKFQFNSI
jgi:hypothetical protein